MCYTSWRCAPSDTVLINPHEDAFAIFDVGGIVLLLAHPEVLTRLLMLFVSAYLLSTAYKVRLHSEKMLDEGVFGGSEDTGKESEQSLHSILQSQAKDEFDADAGAGVDHKLAEREKLLLVYKKDLPNELQPVRFCSLHYWMVHLFAASRVINPLASPALAPYQLHHLPGDRLRSCDGELWRANDGHLPSHAHH